MSSSERIAWIRLASIVLVFVPYFWLVTSLFMHDGARAKPIYVLFLVAGIVHGLLNGLAQAAVHAVFGREMADERDRAVEALALRVAYFALISLLLGALGTLAVLGFLSPPDATGRIVVPDFVVTSQYVFCSCVLAEATRHVVQIMSYRKAVWT